MQTIEIKYWIMVCCVGLKLGANKVFPRGITDQLRKENNQSSKNNIYI